MGIDHHGRCLCGSVRYRAQGPLRPVVACHCRQCRRTSGHHAAATAVGRDRLEVAGEVTWHISSPGVRRGFCRICGSNLFWDRESLDSISIFAGTLDSPDGLKLSAHIFVSDKGGYYDIADGLPQFAESAADRQNWPPE